MMSPRFFSASSIRMPARPWHKLLLLAALGSVPASAIAAPDNKKLVVFEDTGIPEARPIGVEEKRYLAFGEAMFDYYSRAKFSALTRLLVNRERGLFDDNADYAELMMGDLYVSLGLPEHAERIFNRLLERDLLRQTRAETWLHKGLLHYREGRYDAAIDVLDSDKVNGLPPDMRARRNLMLANLYMYQEDFAGALRFLYDIPSDTKEGAYANYNMGVAMVRSGHADQGLELLQAVMNLSQGDEETNALKDRAALAIGLTELKRENFLPARQSLLNVRADGPFSNEALLALGIANFDRGHPKKALPLWLELVRRDPGHQSVQEALMLAPRAYEELSAMPQALAGYQFAANTYRQELKRVELAIRDIDREKWLDGLKPTSGTGEAIPDPMAPVEDYTSSGGPEMAYLYKLFASHNFSRLFQQYMELDRMRRLLERWAADLPALSGTLAEQKSRIAANLQPVRETLVEKRKKQIQLENSANELLSGIPARLDMSRPEDLASLPELIMYRRIQALESRANNAGAWQQERLRRVRGLLLWDIATDAAEQRQKQERQASNLVEMSAVSGVRLQALERLVQESTLRLRGDLGDRIAAQYERISTLQQQIDTLITDLKQILKNDALEVLAENRRRLGDRLGEAHLAIARVQDESVSVSETEEQSESGEATQP
jgi:tetratricopeptide (TPR) repeat protein